MFDGNEATWKRWKKVFDVLGIEGGKGGGGSIESQVLRVTNSEDLVKLRALAKLCSHEFFDDPSLLVVAWRRIMEVLETRKKANEVKGEKEEGAAREVEILDACAALGQACGWVRDFDDMRRYYKRAKEGYKEQPGRDSEKALDVTYSLMCATVMSDVERIEKYRDLLKRMEKALGEENVVTLETLNQLGDELHDNKEYDEAVKVYERYLAGRMKVLGEDHQNALDTLNNLGIVYDEGLKNYEKGLEYYKRALEGSERSLGKNHPSTLPTVECIACAYSDGVKDYEKEEEYYERAIEGYEAQLGKDQIERRIVQ
ncbi:hypothetical protein TL16_g06201 [Triparma laevis f. inornata]|uniref:Kinesin light chain n=1 Tax=Triparma laevis f. inornata TaxID=1714386 RepID=A0A9W7AT65_9STRA|nr:hypothetical protein TL16_g06201 [Triparma laevis f. inornata]